MKAYANKPNSVVLNKNALLGIQYGGEPAPESRYKSRELAAADCIRLNQTSFEAGSHCCAFAVDQLPEGDFAIFCACHPLSLAAV